MTKFFVTLLFILCQLCIGCTASTASITPLNSGSINITVRDGFSEDPLSNAQIVIPELGKTYTTDSNGSTGNIDIPILPDTRFDSIYPFVWGECTLLVYHEGYIPYALFHVAIWENQARQGPNIYLFPADPGENNQPFTVVEAPQRLWVRGLLEKFAP